MPAKTRKPVEKVQFCIKCDKALKDRLDKERLKMNLSQHELLYFMADKCGWHVPVRGRR